MVGFFKLISYFQTQSEPAYCGLASLAMVLNALAIDPGRKWKGYFNSSLWWLMYMFQICLLSSISGLNVSNKGFDALVIYLGFYYMGIS